MRYDCYEMSRPRRYETAADKQEAYRDRKRNEKNLSGGEANVNVVGTATAHPAASPPAQNNFPVRSGDTVRTERSGALAGYAPKPSAPFTTKKVGEFRMIVLPEEEKPATEPPAVPTAPIGGIYRNDQGGVISKFAWEKLQKLKEKAKEGGYTLDEYSQ